MQLASADRLLLIVFVSDSCFALSAFMVAGPNDVESRSLPARSAKFNLPVIQWPLWG